jgi:hypothetical protein
MIKVTLEIDNKTAHSCSPLEFLRKFVLLDAKEIQSHETEMSIRVYDNPYAEISINRIEQI